MGSEIEKTESRLKSFLDQLQLEQGILDRMVYKNKNQHRRCSYFQYLLRVNHHLLHYSFHFRIVQFLELYHCGVGEK